VKGPRDKGLLALLGVGLVLHVLVLWGNLQSPFGRTPINDAAHYWEWGGRVADGEWVGEAPFFSAPLYPYVLGLLRMLGVGLTGLMVLQLVLHVATAGVLARVGARLFDRRVGLVTAALWLVATDPAAAHGRVLAGTWQTLLVALVLERALALQEEATPRRALLLGVVTGVASLAWPALLPASFVLAAWAAWVGAGLRGGALVLGSAALTIVPATAHNMAAADVFVPISAHAGITFWHGNNPSATGVFAPHEVSAEKSEHDADALARTREALGEDAGWGDVSGHFLGKGLEWWKAEPGRALSLAFRKAWLFVSGRVYGDMYLPGLERDAGLWPTLWCAPVPVAWLVLPALLAGVLLVRRDPRRFIPVALVLVLPFAICTVFWYSPRYRLPAVPAATLLAAWALVELWTRRGRAPLVAASLVLALGSGWINRAAGIDGSSELATEVELRAARLALDEGRADQVAPLWERVVARDPRHPVREQLAWFYATHPDDEVRDGARAAGLAAELSQERGGQHPSTLGLLAAALAEAGDGDAAAGVALRAEQAARAQGRPSKARDYGAWAEQFARGEPLRIDPRRIEP